MRKKTSLNRIAPPAATAINEIGKLGMIWGIWVKTQILIKRYLISDESDWDTGIEELLLKFKILKGTVFL